MRFPPAFLDEVRSRVPISAVVGQRVTWDRRKTNAARGDWWACCPFHGENTPSFHCEDKKGRYHCFGCGVSGDQFRFLTELDGSSFPEAVERVAEMAGLPLPARDPGAERRERERASLTDVMEMAAAFFEARLQAPDGAAARAYLRSRGLTPATQQRFRLGHAPDSRNALKEHLAGKGVEKAQIEACGLTVFGDDVPVSYDRFRDRVMFPIPDSRGAIIAFGGRALSAEAPAKYLNSPETALFHKGNVLYNFRTARQALQKGGTLIAVEGYMDVIALAQAGFEAVVAPLGTALGEAQLELLWRLSPEPVLCFDGDAAGVKAAWRAADQALPLIAPGRTLRVAILPDGKDPDDVVRQGGAEAFAAILAEARPLSELLWMRETEGGVYDTPEKKAALEQRLRALTALIGDDSLRYHYGQEMRSRVQALFGTGRRPAEGRGPGGRAAAKGQRLGASAGPLAASERLTRSALVRRTAAGPPLREATLVVALANHPALIEEHFEAVAGLELSHPELRRLHAALLDALAHGKADDRGRLAAALGEAGLAEAFARAVSLVKSAGQWPALGEAALEDARDAFVQALHLHLGARSLHRELKAAEAALAAELTDENYRHMLDVQAQLREAQATDALIEGFGVSSGRAGR